MQRRVDEDLCRRAEEIRKLSEEVRKLKGEIGEVGRKQAEDRALISKTKDSLRAMETGAARNDQGVGTSTAQGTARAAPAISSSAGIPRPQTALTIPFSQELSRRMGVGTNDLLPEWAPEGERPQLHGAPVLRINWGAPFNSEENKEMVSRILQDMTADPSSEYLRKVQEAGGIEVVEKLCLDTVRHRYHRRNRERLLQSQGKVEEDKRRHKLYQRRINKKNKRDKELRIPGNNDLVSRYGRTKWNIAAAISDEETDTEQERARATGEGIAQPPDLIRVLPEWRSRQLEEIVRETDCRRQGHISAPCRQSNPANEAFFAPPGEEPKTLPASIHRWMVSRVFADCYPDAVRYVSFNLPCDRTPDPQAWGDPPPYVVREPDVGALAGSRGGEQRRAQRGEEGDTSRAGRAPCPGTVERRVSMPHGAAQDEAEADESEIDEELRGGWEESSSAEEQD